eukprot:2747530-Ditylum_brightwellii.AAC.1
MFESEVAAATQNSLPTVLGKFKQELDMVAHLSSIPTLKHWDAMKGTQGMVYNITEEQPNAQEQIFNAISIVLAKYSEASYLFQELHMSKASARDIQDVSDPLSTGVQYLWATLKAHNIMAEYI